MRSTFLSPREGSLCVAVPQKRTGQHAKADDNWNSHHSNFTVDRRPQPATATRTPPQNSPLSANLLRNGLQTDYWRTCCHWACWAVANRGLMTGTDAPPSGRARPLRCYGYVESQWRIYRVFRSFEEALEDACALQRSLANSQTQVLVLPLATAGGTVRDHRSLEHCIIQSASKPAVPDLHLKGYHVPAVRHRDAFYQKLEDERAAALGQN